MYIYLNYTSHSGLGSENNSMIRWQLGGTTPTPPLCLRLGHEDQAFLELSGGGQGLLLVWFHLIISSRLHQSVPGLINVIVGEDDYGVVEMDVQLGCTCGGVVARGGGGLVGAVVVAGGEGQVV